MSVRANIRRVGAVVVSVLVVGGIFTTPVAAAEPVGRLAVSSSADIPVVEREQWVRFTTTMTNIGTIPISTPDVTEILPDEFVPWDLPWTDGAFGVGSVALAPGESYTWSRDFWPERVADGTVSTYRTIFRGGNPAINLVLPNPCPDAPRSNCANVTVMGGPDLGLPPIRPSMNLTMEACVVPSRTLCDPDVESVWADDATLQVGGRVVYRVIVSNPGETTFNYVEVTVRLSFGHRVSLPSAVVSQGYVSPFSPWRVGELAPGARATMVLQAALPSAGGKAFGDADGYGRPNWWTDVRTYDFTDVTVGTNRQFAASLRDRVLSPEVLAYARKLRTER